MKKILFLMIVVALSVLTLASCAWIGGENECAHEVTMPVGAGKAATCSEEGLTPGKKCADCGTVIEEQKAIAKIDHVIETIAPIKATCEKEGFTSGEKCKNCGEVIKAPTSLGYGHVLGEDGKCTLCESGNQGGNEGGNQGGNEGGNQGGNEGGNQGGSTESGDQDGIMDTEWDELK